MRQLTKADVAFADIIFEGRIQDVIPDKYKTFVYVFDVVNVVKGSLSQKQVVVGLTRGPGYSPPKSIEEFINLHGDYTRIALTTPEQVEEFCSIRKTKTWVGGATEPSYVDMYRCDNSLLRGHPRAKEIPVIVRQPCGYPYIFSVEKYTKMENYKENYKKFEYLIENTRGTYDHHELYEEMTGGAPLPWEMHE